MGAGVEREVGGEKGGSSNPSPQCCVKMMVSVWVASGPWTWQAALPMGGARLVYAEGWAQAGNTCYD